MSDGTSIIRMLEKKFGQIEGYHKNPNNHKQKVENMKIILDVLKKNGISFPALEASCIKLFRFKLTSLAFVDNENALLELLGKIATIENT